MKRWYGGMCNQIGIPTGEKRDIIRAISLAESSGVADMFGDFEHEDEKWGQSVGPHQIRTLKAETGKGTDRDIERVLNPLENLKAAWSISKQGTVWTPWSVFNSGSYLQFMPGKPGFKADYIVDFGPWESYRRAEVTLELLEAVLNTQLDIKNILGVLPDATADEFKDRL